MPLGCLGRHRTHSVQARQRVMGSNDEQFAALYTENCKQQAEMDAVERRLMAKVRVVVACLLCEQGNRVRHAIARAGRLPPAAVACPCVRYHTRAPDTCCVSRLRVTFV